jgi:hypothetical protein
VGSISSGNFFVPLLIGAVDMAKYLRKYKRNNIKTERNIYNNSENYKFASYLVGLFEGDGHI